MTGKQEGPYKGEETKAEEDKVWHCHCQEPITAKKYVFQYAAKKAASWRTLKKVSKSECAWKVKETKGMFLVVGFFSAFWVSFSCFMHSQEHDNCH